MTPTTFPKTPQANLLLLTSPPVTDRALKIALAEYSNVLAARSDSHQGSGARYAQFLVVFGAGISFLGLIVRDGPARGDLALAAASTAAVLLVGVATHVRLVHFTLTQDRYQATVQSLREYLVGSDKDLRRAFEMPVEGVLNDKPSPTRSLTHLVSLAGHVSLLNGLVATALGAVLLQLANAEPVWSWLVGPMFGLVVVGQRWQRSQLNAEQTER